MAVTLPTKLPAEQINVTFTIEDLMTSGRSIASVICTATVATGTDPSPSSILVGSTSFEDTYLTQQVEAGVAGVTYQLAFVVTLDDGEIVEQLRLLPVATTR